MISRRTSRSCGKTLEAFFEFLLAAVAADLAEAAGDGFWMKPHSSSSRSSLSMQPPRF